MHMSQGKKYFVSARRDDEYVAFYAQQDESGNWAVVGELPDWVKEVERQILISLESAITNSGLDHQP